MSIDMLILNTACVDFRSSEFGFAEKLVTPGGLVRCQTKDMPDYSQQQYRKWIEQDVNVSGGGPANCAPLLAKAGFKTAVGVVLGKGDYDGFDVTGKYFYDVLAENNVDLSAVYTHPELPTGITFIYDASVKERGGLCHFPNANDAFDFDHFKDAIKRLRPKVVHYMYSGLSKRGDANSGQDLADFIKWCREQGCITMVDAVTQISNLDSFNLLKPVLPEVDLFFTSSDEANLIVKTFGWSDKLTEDDDQNNRIILDLLAEHFWKDKDRSRIFGITAGTGAYEKHIGQNNIPSESCKVESRFMSDSVVDLVGAGDSFRSGFLAYLSKNTDMFRSKTLNWRQAIDMGNLFASSYVKAPLNDRYKYIKSYDEMLQII